jgi:hypothetical protein
MHVHVLYHCICLVKYSAIKSTRLRSPYNLPGRPRDGLESLHYSFLTFDGQRHAPGALTPGKRPGTYCTGDWVGHRAGLGGCGGTYVKEHDPSTQKPTTGLYPKSEINPMYTLAQHFFKTQFNIILPTCL